MWHDIEQNTDEWLELRAGKVTGSACAKIMANYGKAFGNPAKDLAAVVAVEQLTGKRAASSSFMNEHMERGHIEEPIARAQYETQFFTDVKNGGFYDNGATGCSPDGLAGDNGVIEIKSAIVSIHYARIKRASYDPAYKWQLLFNLRESGREWIDFVSYCADFPPHKRLFVSRLNVGDFSAELGEIEARLYEFFELVHSIKKIIADK